VRQLSEYLVQVRSINAKTEYDSTIGRMVGTKPNPLWNMTITCQGASKFADIDLGLDIAICQDKSVQAAVRDAARNFIRPHLGRGEGMRCWLGVSGNPRINIWLRRRGGIIGVELENTEIVALIGYWCSQAGCRLH
jgi:hypothetical protein